MASSVFLLEGFGWVTFQEGSSGAQRPRGMNPITQLVAAVLENPGYDEGLGLAEEEGKATAVMSSTQTGSPQAGLERAGLLR